MSPKNSRQGTDRRGAMIFLLMLVMVVIVVMAAFCIDISYMQLVRTELQAASDAASRSATDALARGLTEEEARQIAIETARQNLVAGKGYVMDTNNIIFGSATPNTNGKVIFSQGQQPANAARVLGDHTKNSSAGSVNLFLGRVLGHSTFDVKLPATSAERQREICVVCPKPPPPPPQPVPVPVYNPVYNPTYQPTYYPTYYPSYSPTYSPTYNPAPQPVHCPTSVPKKIKVHYVSYLFQQSSFTSDSLVMVFQSFIASLKRTPAPEQVSLVTYAGTPSTRLELTTDLDQLPFAAIGVPGEKGRSIGNALSHALTVVTNASRVRGGSQRVIVLIADSFNTSGPSVESISPTAVSQKVVVHTIGVAGQCDQNALQSVASATGGKSILVNNIGEIEEAMIVLGLSAPVVMTE